MAISYTEKLELRSSNLVQAELGTQPSCKAPLDLTQLCEGTIKFDLCLPQVSTL